MAREELLNTPLESGVRSLIVLAAVKSAQCDLGRLLFYDYLLVHSGDIDDGPPSLHAPSPFRSGELVVRRDVVKEGLNLVCSKGLVLKTYENTGIIYSASQIASTFLDYFECSYFLRAREVAKWIRRRFDDQSDEELQSLVSSNVGRWGTEFVNDPFVGEEF